MLEVKIRKRVLEVKEQTISVDDPLNPGQKKDVIQQVPEYVEKEVSEVIQLPNTEAALEAIEAMKETYGYDTQKEARDQAVRYDIEIIKQEPDTEAPPADVRLWFLSTCGRAVFDLQARQEEGRLVRYVCPYCGEQMATETRR